MGFRPRTDSPDGICPPPVALRARRVRLDVYPGANSPCDPDLNTEAPFFGSCRGPATTVSLSGREREIVMLVVRGLRNSEIGDELQISEQTVKNHIHNSFKKLGVRDRLELALHAIYYQL
jgi:DNA-binding NarL/FixJ family response regulator